MGAWIVGIVALLGGLAIGAARAKKKAPPSHGCSTVSIALWAQGLGIKAAVVDDPAAIALIGAPAAFDVLVTLSNCTVHAWDGTAWVADPEKTTDLQTTTGFR